MKKMRLFTAAVLLLVLLSLLLAGCGDTHKIIILSGKELIEECPKTANAGETVAIKTLDVTDGEIKISVNGWEDFGEFTEKGTYEFVMPKEDARVEVWVETNGLAKK